ncbi:MAG: hypothetical protein O7A98_03130, partial [Acidobacteria bacterium]|nr:hypothetical protein [Acidobacteriota bacterium]
EGLHPSDLVSVVRYTGSRGVETVLGLTSDLLQVRRAVESLGVVDSALEANDPPRLVLVDLKAATTDDVGRAGGGALPERTGLADIDPAKEIALNLQDLADEQSKVVRGEKTRPILALASALSGLADDLRAIPGYKQVVFLSEGFDSSFLRGTTDRERIERLAQARAVSDVFQVDSDELFGGGPVRSSLLEMTKAFRRADCSIHTVDIGGLRTAVDAREAIFGASSDPAAGATADGLFLIASETGGRFIGNRNNLGKAMREVLDQTAVTYILVLQPPDMVLDGTYHEVKVKLRKVSKGARALHRPGYYSPLPYASERGEIRRLRAADLLATGEDGGRVATGVLAAAFPTGGSQADVLTWVEMYGDGLLEGHSSTKLPIEVYVYAFREDGTIADFATHTVVIDLMRHRWRIEAQGFKHVMRLALEAGTYHVRVLVRNAITGAIGLRTRKLEVPDFAVSTPRLTPPMLIEPDGLWVVGWGQDLASEGEEYPLSYGGQSLVPATDPIMPRGMDILLLMLGFGFNGQPIGLQAELTRIQGGQSIPAAIVLDDYREAADAGDMLWVRIRADSATPAGRYELNVVAFDSLAGARVATSIPVFVQ